MFINTFKLC